ncbi:MAG: glycosyltransferase family 39 protein [Myxococcota bacterium]
MSSAAKRLPEWTTALALFVAVAASLLVGLAGPTDARPGYIHDECYQAFTAHRYAEGDPAAWGWAAREDVEKFDKTDMTPHTTYEWVHPPTAKLIMSASISLLGFTPFAYRLPSVLVALFTMLMAYLIGRRVYGQEAGLLAVGLMAVDGLFFVMSRIAMNDIYVAAMIAGLGYGVIRYFLEPERPLRWMLWSGAFAGLALSTKWNAAPSVLLAGLLFIADIAWRRRHQVPTLRPLLMLGLSFGVLPPLIYLLSYAPFFMLGHHFQDLVKLTQDIWGYHHNLKEGHSSSSHWFQWPFAIRPVWFFQEDGSVQGTLREIYAFPNPLVWVAMFVSVGALAYRTSVEKKLPEFLLLAFFGAVWLPWAVIGRVTFIQYVLPAMTFGAPVLAGALKRWMDRGQKIPVAAYLLGCFLSFANLYPILNGMDVAPDQLKTHRWFWLDIWRTCSGSCASYQREGSFTIAQSTGTTPPADLKGDQQ